MLTATITGDNSAIFAGHSSIFIPPNNRVCCTLEAEGDPISLSLVRPLGFLLWFDPQGLNHTLAIGDSGLLQHDFSIEVPDGSEAMLPIDDLIDRGVMQRAMDDEAVIDEVLIVCDLFLSERIAKPSKHGQKFFQVIPMRSTYELGELPEKGVLGR